MSLSNIENIPVSEVDTSIDVVSLGDGSHDHDTVKVTAALKLAGDIDAEKEAFLLLPLASSAQSKPIVRFTDEPVKTAQQFEVDDVPRSEYDAELVERLEDLSDGSSKKEWKAVATQIGRCSEAISGAAIKVKPGQRDLRLFYEIAAPKVDERQFEFSIIGPLPSFLLTGGGSIGLFAALPRRTSVVSAVALTEPNNPGSEIQGRQDADLAFRHLVGWQWQFDPLFRIRYQYA